MKSVPFLGAAALQFSLLFLLLVFFVFWEVVSSLLQIHASDGTRMHALKFHPSVFNHLVVIQDGTSSDVLLGDLFIPPLAHSHGLDRAAPSELLRNRVVRNPTPNLGLRTSDIICLHSTHAQASLSLVGVVPRHVQP